MYILVAGLNYRNVPVQVRENFAMCGEDLDRGYSFLHSKAGTNIEGSVILTTCNRTEIYAAVRNINLGLNDLKSFLYSISPLPKAELEPFIYHYSCDSAMLHLFRVASGLDSMIIGEGQILTQVKDAYRFAVHYESTDMVLNTLFHKAMHVGKKVRAETGIDTYPTSISHAAVDFALRELGELEHKDILVMGAGEMSSITVRCLHQHGAQKVTIANRTYEKALQLVDETGARAIGFDELPQELPHADLVICCTGANFHLLTYDVYEPVLSNLPKGKIMIIDISVPRNIDPEIGRIPGVSLNDIDQLRNVVDENYSEREKAANLAERIIQEELVKFKSWLDGIHVIPVIAALKAHGEEIKTRELKKAFNKLGDLSEREQNIISSMAHAIVSQLLHDPIVNLKEIAAKQQGHFHAELVKKLFDLSIDTGEYVNHDQTEARH